MGCATSKPTVATPNTVDGKDIKAASGGATVVTTSTTGTESLRNIQNKKGNIPQEQRPEQGNEDHFCSKDLIKPVKPGYSSGASSEEKTMKYSERRRYSSGGSSDALLPAMRGDNNVLVKPNVGLKHSGHGVSSGDGGHHKTTSSDAVGLSDLVKTLKKEGSLNETVIRIETPFGIPIEEIYEGVHDGPVLGSGVSGIVRLVKHQNTGVEYAVKCLDLGLITNEDVLKQLRDEIYIMCQLDHPNIVRLEEVYESESEIYLVQELCLGGDLFDRLDEQPNYHYTEAQCARLVKQMLSSVRYLHSKNIIHRDLKLENFLFSSQSAHSELRMIDFGLSKHFHFGQVHHDAVGTPYTVAPEVIKGNYDERADLWAIGVITYLLLSGETPFGGCDGENLVMVRDNILKGTYAFEPKEVWENVSVKAKDFINMLLQLDYTKRPKAKQAQKHEWLQVNKQHSDLSNGSSSNGNGNHLNPNVVKGLVAFKEYSDMRKLLSEVLSFTLLPEQILELRTEFEKLDTDGDGEISLVELKQVLIESAQDGDLGALNEAEVEDIFNALRVRKTEQTIRWHEFIAGGLSQCAVDERNLQLAFDRLDIDRKGFITFDNIMELMGSNGGENKEELRSVWRSSLQDCNCDSNCISYNDFLLLMKGQPGDGKSSLVRARSNSFTRRTSIGSVGSAPNTPMPPLQEAQVSDGFALSPAAMEGGFNESRGSLQGSFSLLDSGPMLPMSTSKADFQRDHDMAPAVSTTMPPMPGTAQRAVSETPGGGRPVYKKQRSKSMEHVGFGSAPSNVTEEEVSEDDDVPPLPTFQARTSLAVILPAQQRSDGIKDAIQDNTKSNLVVNKTIYRAHREMRMAVLEASKRFEETKARRAIGAGLVMRRGSLMDGAEKAKEYRQRLMMDRAKRRTGRRQRNQKTTSDLTGMMLATPPTPPLKPQATIDVLGSASCPKQRVSAMPRIPQI